MLLILKDPNSVHFVDNIKLEDGYLPAVGEFHPIWSQDGLPQIEPALWFKTDVITCVLMDVHQRLITWSCQPITDKQMEVFRTSDSEEIASVMDPIGTKREIDTETIDLDASFDEMFEAGEFLLNLQNQLKNFGSLSRRERKRASIPDKNVLDKIIIKLIHCYLLPCLKIRPQQLEIVNECFRKQERFISSIDISLEKKMNDVAQTKNALQKKRQTMVDQFQNFKDVLTYPRDILLLMESQFQEDIRNFNLELGHIQDEVNMLKESNSDPEKLAAKRAQRDEIVERQVKFLMARENIINVVALQCPRSKNYAFRTCYVHDEGEFVVCDIGRYDMNAALGMYSKVHEVLQTEREERAALITRKNLMISVREAIKETQTSLRNGEVTTGSSCNKSRSHRATDVLNSTVPDQWLTLTEKVSDCLLVNNEHRHMHLQFVMNIKDKLAAAISVAKLAYRETTDTVLRLQRRRQSYYQVRREIQSAMSASQADFREVKHEVATLLRSKANSCLKFRQRMDSIIQMNDSDTERRLDENQVIQEQIKNEIRLIQAQIHAHFDLMSSELQIALKEQSDVAYYKIWLCYELHFYEDVIHDLVKIYHLSYRLVCSNLRRNAVYVTFHDLSIQEQWLLDLLTPSAGNDVIIETDSDVTVESELDASNSHVEVNETRMDVLAETEDGVELRERRSVVSDTISTSSGSDLENLNFLVKRLSIYEPERGYFQAFTPDKTEMCEPLKRNSRDSAMDDMKSNQSEFVVTSDSQIEDWKATSQQITEWMNTAKQNTNQEEEEVEAIQKRDQKVAANQRTKQEEPANRVADLEETAGQLAEVETIAFPLIDSPAEEDSSSQSEDENSTNKSPLDKPPTASPQPYLNTSNRLSPYNGTLKNKTKERTSRGRLLPRTNQTLPASIKPPQARKTAYRSETFKNVFAVPMATVTAILNEETPLGKLQLMTKCVRQIQTSVSKLHDKIKQKEGLKIVDDEHDSLMCCDDFLTILTLILLHLDAKSLANFYPHVVMLTDMMAPFLTNGLHSNSLTHFYGAYQIIFSSMLVKNPISAKMLK